MRRAGIPTLPPIDITICEQVPTAFDVVDSDQWSVVMELIRAGAVRFLHCGTPCNTFASARKDDGGPPPLRSHDDPLGRPGLSADNEALVFLGNLFLFRSLEACSAVVQHGGDFSIENPEFSLIWETPQLKEFARVHRARHVNLDQCMFGAPSVKPTRLLTSHAALEGLHRRCQGGHKHIRLKGKTWSEFFMKWVFRTKLAQVYPEAMCQQFAEALRLVWSPQCLQFMRSFTLCSNSRKRPIGQPLRWREHRQALTALKAEASGYQLKRGARKPLLHTEAEPGVAIAWALDIPHPLCSEIELDSQVSACIEALALHRGDIVDRRTQGLLFWEHRAQQLLPLTDRLISEVPDAPLRRLLRGAPEGHPCQLGVTCHVALYSEMLTACQSVDRFMPDLLLAGFPIVGPIARSRRWPEYEKPQQVLSIEHACSRAWGIRSKIVARVAGVPVSDNLQKIWDATLEDVLEGSSLGPFVSADEVSSLLGCDDWIPTQRFEVVQKNKVRGCDSATTNLINQITQITEKLQLPSTDTNVAALRRLRSSTPDSRFAGWVLDERKAYRQVGIRPAHRKFSVICLKNPKSGRPEFFVMVGHSFGLVAAVYNYNRRSAAINEILMSLFGLVAFNFYDDKYGFEPVETINSAFLVAQKVHFWLGAAFDAHKLQLSDMPVVLGVTYNLVDWVLEIKESRRKDLIDEMNLILKSDSLDPGQAGKLKGKLLFGASQLWGKVGRAFLRPISERQYTRFAKDDHFGLDPALRESLKQWLRLVEAGPPRSIDFCANKRADCVLFTDGFSPDPRDAIRLPDRIGAVIFDRRCMAPVQFTACVSQKVKRRWCERKTQIIPVEMVATIVAVHTFADRLLGTDLFLFTDSEVVEAALVKGYSCKEDLRLLVSEFWNLVQRLHIRVFIDRVATDSNPADAPSRNDLFTGQKVEWATIEASWPAEIIS